VADLSRRFRDDDFRKGDTLFHRFNLDLGPGRVEEAGDAASSSTSETGSG